MAHEFTLDLIQDLVGFIVRGSNWDDGTILLGSTVDQVSKEQMKTLDHDFVALVLVSIVL